VIEAVVIASAAKQSRGVCLLFPIEIAASLRASQ